MRSAWTKLAVVLAFVAGAAVARAAGVPAGEGTWVVHEWGTFLSVQGSDGTTLGGMVDSEEALPLFVRQRDLGGRSRASFLGKMETPVTYFYTDRPRYVRMRVEMPHGLLTHWFPDVQGFTPPLPQKPAKGDARAPAPTAGSALDWGTFQVWPDDRFLPRGQRQLPDPLLPRVCWVDQADTWRFARATDSALVKTTHVGRPPLRENQELYEKFLFYRGVGTFTLPLEVRAVGPDDQVHLLLHNRGADPLQGLFAVWVHGGDVRLAALGDLSGGATRDVDARTDFTAPLPLEDGVAHLKQEVAGALVRAGLYPKEAQAMVDTWEKSYFRNDGLRILSILPRSYTDAAIPIQIDPQPQQLVRIMVGRVEVLTPGTERRLEKVVADLGSEDPEARKSAEAQLASFGRLREPVLRRVLALSKVAEVRARAETLIAQGAAKK